MIKKEIRKNKKVLCKITEKSEECSKNIKNLKKALKEIYNVNSEKQYKDNNNNYSRNKDFEKEDNNDKNNTNLENSQKKKAPYTLRTIETTSGNINIININAAFFTKEYIIPLWFKKDAYIKFITEGKWRIDDNHDFTNSIGMPSPSTIDFNYGALVARIGSGKSFMISEDLNYVNKNEGPLYLKINLPKKINVNPEGEMEIKIYDGMPMPIEEIYKKIGWKDDYPNNVIKGISEIENDLITNFNNLRLYINSFIIVL